jgi:enoyl-CoA hydratase
VVLAGAGERAFCSGADLKDIAAGRLDEIVAEDGGLAGFVAGHRSKPWIAEVGGIAYGGGMEFALACDLVVASDAARFALPEVKRGRIARGGGAIRLASRIPRAIALEMLATGEPIDAAHAHTYGLVNKLVPHSALREETLLLANAIACNAPIAVQESLALARHAHAAHESELWALNAAASVRINKTEDAAEGLRSFVEKRPPVWTGR